MSQYRITDQAERDLAEIWQRIAAGNPSAADNLIATILARFPLLAEFTQMGRGRDELALDLRRFPTGSYMIFYRPMEDGIEVVRVLHRARDVGNVF